jgi:hypothetical protein
MVAPMSAESELALAKLASYRLENNLTFAELAVEMDAKGCDVAARSLHLWLTRRTVPVERTQYRIVKFVATLSFAPPKHHTKKTRRRRAA